VTGGGEDIRRMPFCDEKLDYLFFRGLLSLFALAFMVLSAGFSPASASSNAAPVVGDFPSARSRDMRKLAFCASNTPLDAAATFSVIIRDRSAPLCGEARRCQSTVLICMFAIIRSPTKVTGLKRRRGISRTLLQHPATEQLDIDVANVGRIMRIPPPRRWARSNIAF